jgi:hypothetical protein
MKKPRVLLVALLAAINGAVVAETHLYILTPPDLVALVTANPTAKPACGANYSHYESSSEAGLQAYIMQNGMHHPKTAALSVPVVITLNNPLGCYTDIQLGSEFSPSGHASEYEIGLTADAEDGTRSTGNFTMTFNLATVQNYINSNYSNYSMETPCHLLTNVTNPYGTSTDAKMSAIRCTLVNNNS